MSNERKMSVNGTTEILNKAMSRLESWRFSEIGSISPSCQITAFHLACITEEKFRSYGLKGFMSRGILAHMRIREDLFALEWCLRSLPKLPDDRRTKVTDLRNKWNNEIAEKCINSLERLSNYHTFRDLTITAKRGGYQVTSPKPDIIIFRDVSGWLGINDHKNHLICDKIEMDRTPSIDKVDDLKSFSIEQTFAHDDFPHGLETQFFSSSEFWNIMVYLQKLSLNAIRVSGKLYKIRNAVRHGHTKELTILRNKNSLINNIANATRIEKGIVRAVLNWISFNYETPKKFSFFHCPLIELNRDISLIAPHSVITAYPPTLFLRLLAHYDKKSFDSASSRLEKQRLKQIKEHIRNGSWVLRTGVKLEIGGEKAELDLVEYNKGKSTLSLVQAKFIIPPDSVSEVDSANSALLKGIEQLEKNRKLIEANNIETLFKLLGVSYDRNVQIRYFLLPSRFTGSDFLTIPSWINVMPAEFCLRPAAKGKSLNLIWEEYRELWNSLDERVRSSRVEEEFELAGFKIVYPGFKVRQEL